MTDVLLLLLVVLLIAANALFVAAEYALVTVDRVEVDRAAEQGDGRAAGLQAALHTLSTQLSGTQLGITVSSLVVGYIAEPALADLLRGPVGLTGLSDGSVTAVSVTVAFLIATVAQMVYGELVPKNWAIAEPMRVGRLIARPQRTFTAVFHPLLVVLNGAANGVVRMIGLEPAEELESARAPAELASLAARSASQGTLPSDTAELLTRSIAFGDQRAADAMTPRPRVRFLRVDQNAADVLAWSARTGHARFPVMGETVDQLAGVVHFKHALAVPVDRRREVGVADLVRPLPAVPESMELDPLLALLRREGSQMAAVVDEYGGTAGIVTLEDLVEEIVGEIYDEQDEEVRPFTERGEGVWAVSGLMRPDEMRHVSGLVLPEGEMTDTLAGLVTERLGRLPEVGDEVEVRVENTLDLDEDEVPRPAGAQLRVERLDGHRVSRIRLERLDHVPSVRPDEAPAEESGDEDA